MVYVYTSVQFCKLCIFICIFLMGGTRRSESTSVRLHSCETSIQKQCEKCAGTAWGRYLSLTTTYLLPRFALD